MCLIVWLLSQTCVALVQITLPGSFTSSTGLL
ncbi:hypothetical protein XFLM_04620 [Xylella fastidiosa subsp. fastidiosa GB514]|nr:hypothetical protein XFLM_04620 [Xylella fastidiosa subsp. fastidiosa GB514]KAF0571402.1 hypothetical protein P305_04760 [Xylella fastidiosa subsp. fastidiosa Mus-1]